MAGASSLLLEEPGVLDRTRGLVRKTCTAQTVLVDGVFALEVAGCQHSIARREMNGTPHQVRSPLHGFNPQTTSASGSSWFVAAAATLADELCQSVNLCCSGVSSAVRFRRHDGLQRPSGESCKPGKVGRTEHPFQLLAEDLHCDSRSKVARNDSLTRCSILSSWLCRPRPGARTISIAR